MSDVAWDGLDQANLTVAEDEGAVGFELVDLVVVVANDDRDVGARECAVGANVRDPESGYIGVGLVGVCRDGPSLPIERTEPEIWYLRWH